MQNIKDLYIGFNKIDIKYYLFHKDCPYWDRKTDKDNQDGITTAIFKIGACECFSKKDIPENLITQLLLLNE